MTPTNPALETIYRGILTATTALSLSFPVLYLLRQGWDLLTDKVGALLFGTSLALASVLLLTWVGVFFTITHPALLIVACFALTALGVMQGFWLVLIWRLTATTTPPTGPEPPPAPTRPARPAETNDPEGAPE